MGTQNRDESRMYEPEDQQHDANDARLRGRRNRGDKEQLVETVEQFGVAIDAHAYRQLLRYTQDETPQPVVHTKRSERR